jgi:hypothetical protein
MDVVSYGGDDRSLLSGKCRDLREAFENKRSHDPKANMLKKKK